MTPNFLAESFAANPLLIDPSRVALVNAALNAVATSELSAVLLQSTAKQEDDFWGTEGGNPYRPYTVVNGVLQIPVVGILLNKFPYQFGRFATGYAYVEKAISRGLLDPDVHGIALMIDSPGGEVAGCWECAEKIRAARDDKPVMAFADYAYSAAFALASSASEVVVSRSGGTGSVGVVTTHVDISGALASEGVKITFIFAGKHKVEGNAYEALSDSVKSRIQDRIDRLYSVFVSLVAESRGMDEKAVRDTEALTYDAQDSVSVGFADRVGALDEELVAFSEGLADQKDGSQMTTKVDDKAVSFTQEQMDAAVAAATLSARAEGVVAEQARRTSILGCDAAKTRPQAAAALIEGGLAATQAVALLGNLPVESATGVAAHAGGVKKTPFEAAMAASPNPNVGAQHGDTDTQMSVVDSVFASVGRGHPPAGRN